MNPTLIVRLVPNLQCMSCGAVGYCCRRTQCCLRCLSLNLALEQRRRDRAFVAGNRLKGTDAESHHRA